MSTVLFVGLLAALAAPIPKTSKAPIEAANADKVVKLFEFDKRINRIQRGPAKGEMTFHDWSIGVEIVDATTLKPTRTLFAKDQPDDYVSTPDGRLQLWSFRKGKHYTVQPKGGKEFTIKSDNHIGDAAISPDGKLLAIGETYWRPDAEGVGESMVKIYDSTGMYLRSLEKSGPGGLKPMFSPDGKRLALSNRNYEPRVFDVATGKLLMTADKRMTQEVAFSPDGKTLACGFVDGSVGLWEIATGKQLHLVPSGCKEIYSVDWTPKGDVLATAGRDGRVILWNPTTMAKLKELDVGFWVIQARFTADGTRLITSSATDYGANGRKVMVWGVGEEK
jgi:WD40 repeat protein